jgi:urease accessory protein
VDTVALVRLLHLASPALPVGAFAYSQGLEQAVAWRWVTDEETAAAWILGLLEHGHGALDVPVLDRLHAAFRAADRGAVRRWSDFLHACRGSRELQDEDRRLGASLARVLETLGIDEAAPFRDDGRATFATLFALAAARWGIAPEAAAAAFAFAWCENQVAAALRLVPLGQSAGQRILARAGAAIPGIVARARSLADEELGAAAPAQAIAAAHHESLYSRLFRS